VRVKTRVVECRWCTTPQRRVIFHQPCGTCGGCLCGMEDHGVPSTVTRRPKRGYTRRETTPSQE
jgi:hypothetical protein